MARFHTDLILRDLGDGKRFELMAPLVYESDLLDRTIIAEAGFITDLASIPLLGNHRDWSKGSVIHDFLYWSNGVTRKQADDVMREAMQVLGVPRWRIGLAYLGVRLGGGKAWQRYRDAEQPEDAA